MKNLRGVGEAMKVTMWRWRTSIVQSQLYNFEQNVLYKWWVDTSKLLILTLKGCPFPVEQEKFFVTPALSP